ncbi:MAG: hypothetical protein GXO33_04310 [Epsilonproteobacteria bacterium]|nr:hypothetical protein [Campylobacterota bacterium]
MIRRWLVIWLGLWIGAHAADLCKDKLFSFDTAEGAGASVTVYDIVTNLAQTCEFSLLMEDKEIKKKIRTPLGLVHIRDYTLDEMFRFLFHEHNMFYDYDPERRILKVSYVKTRSFHVDYVNLSEMKTESIKSITVGASTNTGANGNYGGYGQNSGTYRNSNGDSDNPGGDNSDYTTVKTITEFKFWDNFKEQIDEILQRDEDSHAVKSKSLINKEAGIVTVTGTRRQIERVADYIAKVSERLHKQIMLEAYLIELRYSENNTTGVDWSRFDLKLRGLARKGGTFLLPDGYKLGYQFTMDGLLNFLQHYGDVRTISNPKVMTLNNQPAVINVGDQINYRYETGSVSNYNNIATATNTYALGSVFVGLTLIVVPEVTEDGYILLRINPVVSEQLDSNWNTGTVSYPEEEQDFAPIFGDQTTDASVRSMPPDVKIKQLTSIVKVKNGHKVIIGGLISKRVINTHNKIPVLGDLPVLGKMLFSHNGVETQKVELIVVITPKIVDGTQMPSIDDILKKVQ